MRGTKAGRLPEAASRRGRLKAAAWVLLASALAVAAACGEVNNVSNDYAIATDFFPEVSRTGQATTITIDLRRSDGQLWPGASLQVEAHMSHPGMSPVIAKARETSGGRHSAAVTFTMAGDWKLLIVGQLPDGRRVTMPPLDRAVLPPN